MKQSRIGLEDDSEKVISPPKNKLIPLALQPAKVGRVGVTTPFNLSRGKLSTR
jgi:hypothetical protein